MTDDTLDPFAQAEAAAEQGDYDHAAALYARLIGNRDPRLHVAALLGLADARYRLDDEEGAAQAWLMATQAPETPLAWRAWVALAGARVREGDLPAAVRAYREAEGRAPIEERPAIASRLGWLNKEMGRSWTAQRYFSRARTGVFQPFVTYSIIALTAVVSLAVMFNAAPDLGRLLLLDKRDVMAGEWWRLLTVTLVHGNLIHLAFNMYALYIAGPLVEALYGRVLFVTFYLLAAAGGSVASYLIVANPSVGASGAVFGLFGVLLTSTYVHKPALGRQARALTGQIAMLIVINLAIGFGLGGGFIGAIDNAAHVGGLIAGAWLGFVIVPRGAATLASFWHGLPQAEGMLGDDRVVTLVRVGAVLLVPAVILLALSMQPLWA
jgi:membrane associated rhomboid family serine protease